MNKKSFASDNFAGIHPKILQAINDANQGHEKAYGYDAYTPKAVELFKQHFGDQSDIYFVCNGTAANVLGLSALLKPYEAIICADVAHINVDEAGASEKYIGSKLLTIKAADGKITVEDIKKQLVTIGNQHKVQPKVISITQSTEFGVIYTVAEIKAITEFAHANNLYVHMDGARLCNAAAALNVSLAALTKDVCIDLLSFGGTKNGMMFGDAVIFFNKTLSQDFKYIRKQGLQLISKMRFISAQFIELLSDDLWLDNAKHANSMAQLLHDEMVKIPSIKISRAVQANAVFVYFDPKIIGVLQERYFFYVFDELTSEVRLMTSWDTTKEDIVTFVELIKQATAGTLKSY